MLLARRSLPCLEVTLPTLGLGGAALVGILGPVSEPQRSIPIWVEDGRLKAWRTIERFRQPLVATVKGFALGGGCELTTLCGIGIAGAGARFGLPEVKIAPFPGESGTQRVQRVIGTKRAIWMMMTGQQISSVRAAALGPGGGGGSGRPSRRAQWRRRAR